MQNSQIFNQNGLSRLALVLLRQNHPATPDEGRTLLRNSLSVYEPDSRGLNRALNDYFRSL